MSQQSPSVALPLSPPRLTRNEAEGRSLLARQVRQCELILGDTLWRLSLEPLPRDALVVFGAGDWVVAATWAGAPFELRLPASSATQWLLGRFPALDLPALSEPVRASAFESALQDVLQALQASGQGNARIDSVTQAPAPSPVATAAAAPLHRFGLSLYCGDARLWGTLTTDALGLMLMAGLAAQRPCAAGPVTRDATPLLLRAEIGNASLSRSELFNLRTGDAVLLRHSFVDSGGALWLGAGGWGLRVRADGDRLVVTQTLHMTEAHMDDDPQDDLDNEAHDFAAGTPLPSLDALPIRLVFDLGQRTLPLAEVSELQVGQVLDLGRPLSQAVNIRANGALIGTGELMEIGGRLAVGITSLAPAGAGAAP